MEYLPIANPVMHKICSDFKQHAFLKEFSILAMSNFET